MTVYKLPIVLTVDDLEGTPDDGNRYEVIDGDLYVSGPPSYVHQSVLMNLGARVWINIEIKPTAALSLALASFSTTTTASYRI